MPAWVTPVVALGTLLFGAGGAWAIQAYRQSNSEKIQSDVVKDLKECVTKLQGLVTEVEVMKVANARSERRGEDHEKRLTEVEVMKVANARAERQGEDHEKRLTAVEIAVAKLQPRRKR